MVYVLIQPKGSTRKYKGSKIPQMSCVRHYYAMIKPFHEMIDNKTNLIHKTIIGRCIARLGHPSINGCNIFLVTPMPKYPLT